MVGELLHTMGYRFQLRHPAPSCLSRRERQAGFERIHRQVKWFHQKHLPVLALEMTKRERSGPPQEVGPDPDGVSEWVPAATDQTTGAVAVECLRRWWTSAGALLSPEADALLLTVEGAGSFLYHSGLWKKALQGVVDAFGLSLTVLAIPAGMHKWNGIDGRTVARVREKRHRGPCTEHEGIIKRISSERSTLPRKAPCPPELQGVLEEKKATESLIPMERSSSDNALGPWDFSLAPLR